MKLNPPPRRPVRFFRALIALTLGLFVGVCFHYVLYRLSLPSKPFIYVAF
jgi:hypothetical protein